MNRITELLLHLQLPDTPPMRQAAELAYRTAAEAIRRTAAELAYRAAAEEPHATTTGGRQGARRMSTEIVYVVTPHQIETHEVLWDGEHLRFPYRAHLAPGYPIIRQSDDTEWIVTKMSVDYDTRALWATVEPKPWRNVTESEAAR